MISMDVKRNTNKEPWPDKGIKEGSSINDYNWGYMLISEKGLFHFDLSVRPSYDEIYFVWAQYLKGASK